MAQENKERDCSQAQLLCRLLLGLGLMGLEITHLVGWVHNRPAIVRVSSGGQVSLAGPGAHALELCLELGGWYRRASSLFLAKKVPAMKGSG